MHTDSVNTMTSMPGRAQHDLHQLRETTGRVLGSVFYGTLLATMRESKLKGPYGHGGRGEEVFAAQLHGLLAERAGSTLHRELTDGLLRGLEKQQRLISAQRDSETGTAS